MAPLHFLLRFLVCHIGLDGIRVLDPSTSRTLKVYSLDTVTRWEVLDSNIFAFWTRSSIDINERRVRLKSNSYTTTNILDMVAAASIQFKEMDGMTVSEQVAEKKKGFPDWINLRKPVNEEKDHWVPDEASTKCTSCSSYFGAFLRRHHCRNCGDIFCDKCTQGRIALTAEENAPQVRVCDQCMSDCLICYILFVSEVSLVIFWHHGNVYQQAEVTQRMSHVNEVASRASGYNRHEELAKKLQEEMEKKRKMTPGTDTVPKLVYRIPNGTGSSISKKTTGEKKTRLQQIPSLYLEDVDDEALKSDAPGQRMKEVECPTCTVHLQVEVPATGSKTIECSVCQHPFLILITVAILLSIQLGGYRLVLDHHQVKLGL
ncbi:zinc finger, FYVE/PHD-type, Zinc finger, RING/FYVE/PHD-type [Artemisia annua]|uniref:Zinc finger, FYVE/PHD-type, Zinc finger, RING/FYVE/PHD-type n=1 Tax=Artemisia annua TaxID=35608 RepID=A0A2U1PLB4_ARTAN|nr:zinc finger, FYVE/PHD-type, Zinc finger, RING/FYVE/PHD-type [Artemisia annua]